MISTNFDLTQLKEAAQRYESTEPLGWQEVQGIHKFIDHLATQPTEEPNLTACMFCGMTRTNQPLCPYCGC